MGEQKRGGFWKHPVVFVGGLTLMATLASTILWALDYRVASTVVGMTTILLWLLFIIVATAAVASWWSAGLMERGANIALNAQVSDDKRDVQLLKTTGDMMRTWQQAQSDLPALPMPGQKDGWLCDFEEGDYEEVN